MEGLDDGEDDGGEVFIALGMEAGVGEVEACEECVVADGHGIGGCGVDDFDDAVAEVGFGFGFVGGGSGGGLLFGCVVDEDLVAVGGGLGEDGWYGGVGGILGGVGGHVKEGRFDHCHLVFLTIVHGTLILEVGVKI